MLCIKCIFMITAVLLKNKHNTSSPMIGKTLFYLENRPIHVVKAGCSQKILYLSLIYVLMLKYTINR